MYYDDEELEERFKVSKYENIEERPIKKVYETGNGTGCLWVIALIAIGLVLLAGYWGLYFFVRLIKHFWYTA